MRVVLDGSVCFDKFGACYHYYTELVPRLTQRGCAVTLTPSPTGALEVLAGQGAKVAKPVLPGGGWLRPGPTRRVLSKVKQTFESYWLRTRLERDTTFTVFQSFFYTLPTSPSFHLVGMILDVIPEKFPQWYSTPADLELIARRKECIRRAARLIAISECAKRDVCEIHGVDPDKVDVIPLGIHPEAYRQRPDEATLSGLRHTHGLHRPFFLQVGGRKKHKNFSALLRAYGVSLARVNYDLVCVGDLFEADELALIAELGLEGKIRHIHRPSEETLRALYHMASALAYPSLYEGFGLPPLEAMASGLPVAAARAASIPEVCGDAVEYFDPTDVRSITHALDAIVDPARAQSLRERGHQQAAKFSWDRTAKLTLEVYQRVHHGQTFLSRHCERTEAISPT